MEVHIRTKKHKEEFYEKKRQAIKDRTKYLIWQNKRELNDKEKSIAFKYICLKSKLNDEYEDWSKQIEYIELAELEEEDE